MGSSSPPHISTVFVYGSLLADDVVRSLLGRLPPSLPAVLPHFQRISIKGRVHPAIVPAEDKKVTGKVLLGITPPELHILDEFEGVEFKRASVNVFLKDGTEKSEAYTYVWENKTDPDLYGEWDFEMKMEQWKRGAYEAKYLTLLDNAISGNCHFGRHFDRLFWDAFTLELNTQIAVEEPDFLGFNPNVVVNYGRFLRNKYNDLKTKPDNLANFALLERCFKKCDRCEYTPKFPFSEKSEAYTYVWENKTDSDLYDEWDFEMEQWEKGAYDVKYLTLLDNAISGNCHFGRRFDRLFWDAFTLELNTQIAAEDFYFRSFNPKAVVNYGRFLRNKYNDLKTQPDNLANFGLLERCFKKCDRCEYTPKFPFSGICDISDRLAALLNNGHLSAGQYWSSLDYLSSKECSARSWLGLSQHCQVSSLKYRFPYEDI